ncbi:hypothetical protein [Pantoea sp. OXWO6B1]|uniref:hypothetical protein n=1 Tax=Pantoea sp. OXWO6B1 TaxID=1835724 RepID=UPI0007C66CCC|nr:hypothetical protein [Pantoea sp. OXWO6B1]OAD98000.1 hypothetical protein A6A26_23940 [Pantoea sp. OXWO6B1]
MMIAPVDYDFVSGKTLSDYGIEVNNEEFSFKSVSFFHGNVLRLVATYERLGEIIFHPDAGTDGVGVKLKVKNAKGNAFDGM